MSRELKARDDLVRLGRALYDRGVTHGRTGNLSQLVGDRIIVTPTGSCLGRLDPAQLAVVDLSGARVTGPPPSKEIVLHLALYQEHPDIGAVAHVHSTNAVAWSCLDRLDLDNALPPLTAYFVMRVGNLPVVRYIPPGAPALAEAVREANSYCVLLAHHGSVAGAPTLEAAVDAVEEIEETARIALLLRGTSHRHLTNEQVNSLLLSTPLENMTTTRDGR